MVDVTGTIFERLSPGELRIMPALSTGWPDQKVADLCCIERTTMRTHVRHIHQKLNVESRAELAVAWARYTLIVEIADRNKISALDMLRVHRPELLKE